MNTVKQLAGIAAVGMLSASAAFAVPNYDTFGAFPDLTAGGVNGNVAVTTEGNLTLALTAQQRWFNPALGNNGAGIFTATTGQNNGLGPSAFQGATWNFDFYIKNTGLDVYTYQISYREVGGTTYSFNPLADVDALGYFASTGAYQDSQNLLFSTFGGAPNLFTTFDPNANATYEFRIKATDALGNRAADVSISVVVGTGTAGVPDAGSTLALLGAGIAGLACIRRKLA